MNIVRVLVVTRLAGWLYRQREHRLPANRALAPADRRIRRIVVKWLMHTRTFGACEAARISGSLIPGTISSECSREQKVARRPQAKGWTM